jgi:hypothetical protein
MNPTQPVYNTEAIRRLLLAAFSDEEFTIFCYDNFREVHQKFSASMTFTAKAQLMIEYCERRSEFDELLALIEEANPARYAEFAPSLLKVEFLPFNPPNLHPSNLPQQALIRTGPALMGCWI